jgi:membrane protein implicated in regulation of membrane protease activity
MEFWGIYLNIVFFWSILAIIFFILEIFVTGIGFIFAGLSAITLAVLINFDLIAEEEIIYQLAWFFILSFAWAVPLYKLFRKYANEQKEKYSNIIGDVAVVLSEVITKEKGKISWSGTIVEAKLAKDNDENELSKGANVKIVNIVKSVFIVKSTH